MKLLAFILFTFLLLGVNFEARSTTTSISISSVQEISKDGTSMAGDGAWGGYGYNYGAGYGMNGNSDMYVPPEYDQIDFQKCPFSHRSESVDKLIGSSLDLLSQLDDKECQGVDNDVVGKLMARYQEIMPTRSGQDNISGRDRNGNVNVTRRFQKDSCVNFKMKYKTHFNTAVSFIDRGLSIPGGNMFGEVCYFTPQGTELSEDEKTAQFECLDKALESKLAEKDLLCEGEINEEMEVFYAESIMGVSQLLGNVLAGNCASGSKTLYDSLFNIASEYVSLAAFSYPGLATAAITNIIGPLFKSSTSPMEQLTNSRNMEKLQCMHHSLEKAKCKTSTTTYRDWIKNETDQSHQCYFEEAMGIPNEIMVLAGEVASISLNQNNTLANIQYYFNQIEKTNFFEKFNGVKKYIEENVPQRLVDSAIKMDESFTSEDNKKTFDGIYNTYQWYKKAKEEKQSPFQIAKGLKSRLSELPASNTLNLSRFFTLYADIKASNDYNETNNQGRYFSLMRLSRFEGDRLADELISPMNELMRQNDKKALKEVTAAFVDKTHDRFEKHLKNKLRNLSSDMKAFYKDKAFDKEEKEELFTSISSIVMTCKLNGSMFYYNEDKPTIDQMIASGGFSDTYKDLCGTFKNCIVGSKDKLKNNLGNFNRYVCTNNYAFSMNQVRSEFDVEGKVCGKSFEQIYKAVK